MGRLGRLARDRRGAVIIELAIVAPVLALMVIGVVDISNGFSRKLGLEQGAQRALEKIMQTTDDTTVEATLANEAVCQVNGMNSDGSCKLSPITVNDVTITYRLECTDSSGGVTAQSNTDSTVFNAYKCSNGSTEARFISVRVTDRYTPLFPVTFGANSDGTYHISATAGIRQQ